MFGGTIFVEEFTERNLRSQKNKIEKQVNELEYEIKQFEDRWISEEKWVELQTENDYLCKTLEMFIRALSEEDRLKDLASKIRRYPNEPILALFREVFPEIYEELE